MLQWKYISNRRIYYGIKYAHRGGARVKPAFTLAEVLITLGIIGVVSALTMPSLIANYKKKVWVTQFKKDVNYIQNSLNRIMADEEVDNFLYTSVVYNERVGNNSANTYGFSEENKISDYLKLTKVPSKSKFAEYLKVIDTDAEGFNLPDGSCIGFSFGGNSLAYADEYTFGFYIDVNCDRKPNKGGRDRFMIYLNENNKLLIPYWYNFDSKTCDHINDKIDDEDEKLWMDYVGFPMCSYRIINENWEMTY